MITIKLNEYLDSDEQLWLAKNIGPRLHYIHNSIGGEGWIARKKFDNTGRNPYWELSFQDDRYASFFLINFPQ
jgi:hypothetical protein